MNQTPAKRGILGATFALLSVLAASPLCSAGSINFDNVPSTTQLTNQYASQGVLFDQISASAQFATSVVPVSAPNYASPFFADTTPGMFFFVDPSNSAIEAYTDSVTITLNGYNNVGGWFSGAIIDALDVAGNVIPGQTQTIAPTTGVNLPNVNLSFSGPIHALRFTNVLNSNGHNGIFPFDNLAFGPLTDTPEPATVRLAGLLLVAASVRKRFWRGGVSR